jgi:hypothetical protein
MQRIFIRKYILTVWIFMDEALNKSSFRYFENTHMYMSSRAFFMFTFRFQLVPLKVKTKSHFVLQRLDVNTLYSRKWKLEPLPRDDTRGTSFSFSYFQFQRANPAHLPRLLIMYTHVRQCRGIYKSPIHMCCQSFSFMSAR